MSEDLITVGPEDSLMKVKDIFHREKIHHLPVIDEGLLAGMISKSDYLYFMRGFNEAGRQLDIEDLRLKTTKVKEIMTTGLAKLEPEDRLDVALEVFKENLFHAIPVVKNGRIKGIVTTLDIVRYFADNQAASVS